MKKVRVIKQFNYLGTKMVPGMIVDLPDHTAMNLTWDCTVEYLFTPENRQMK